MARAPVSKTGCWGFESLLACQIFDKLKRIDVKPIEFIKEVKAELKKVTWPTRKETLSSTYVVLVVVAVSSAFLGLVDGLLAWLVKEIFS